MEDYHPRWLDARVREALSDTPVVLLNGARQTGKSSLAERHAGPGARARYVSLDDPTELSAARSDPMAFCDAAGELLVIDEVQKAPELFAAIKRQVDKDRRPGRYLLTGSADVMLLPQAAESLAGRMEILSLQPLARREIQHQRPRFIEKLYANNPEPLVPGAGRTLPELVALGGFPEAQQRAVAARRQAWFEAYVTTITQRDLRDISSIADVPALPRLLRLSALRSGALSNVAEIARASGIAQVTLHRYLHLLEACFLIQPLAAWHANLGKRLIKAPKTYLLDSGLACALSGVSDPAQLVQSHHYGGLLETWVLGELRREAASQASPVRLHHYRSAGGVEVDVVIEDAAGAVAGVEVKATRTLGDKHFAGLRDMQASLGERFRCGVVLYGGDKRVKFGDRLWAVPMTA